jgi:peptidoglycan/xylan/chitin deacetylase (PgdA/CDA1 family)
MKSGLAGPLSFARPPLLLVVNYHRIWPARGARSDFDDGVFGPDVDEFRTQMQWLTHATTILDEEGLLKLCSSGGGRRGQVYSAVTFDDAYVDCYTLARPVMERSGIRGIFFVPIETIDSRQLGWWDLAAYILKKSKEAAVSIQNDVLDLRSEFDESLRRVLRLFKLRPATETGNLLAELSKACDVPLPGKDEQSAQLMTWEQVREMRASGHGIGSHTFSHRVLATLSQPEQEHEVKASRTELAARIGGPVLSLAYPVGGPKHINEHSVRFAREAGYEQAFTFNTGVSEFPVMDRYRIPREPAHTLEELKAKVQMPGLMGLHDKQGA